MNQIYCLNYWMQIVAAILLCMVLGYFWIWLVQHLFLKKRKTFSFSLLATSIFLVGSLYVFSYIVGYFLPNFDQAIFSLPWFGYFLLYCALIFLFLIFVNAN